MEQSAEQNLPLSNLEIDEVPVAMLDVQVLGDRLVPLPANDTLHDEGAYSGLGWAAQE
jgi:hypothetical protein